MATSDRRWAPGCLWAGAAASPARARRALPSPGLQRPRHRLQPFLPLGHCPERRAGAAARLLEAVTSGRGCPGGAATRAGQCSHKQALLPQRAPRCCGYTQEPAAGPFLPQSEPWALGRHPGPRASPGCWARVGEGRRRRVWCPSRWVGSRTAEGMALK